MGVQIERSHTRKLGEESKESRSLNSGKKSFEEPAESGESETSNMESSSVLVSISRGTE